MPDKLTMFYSGCALQEVIPREYVLDCYDGMVAEAGVAEEACLVGIRQIWRAEVWRYL